MAVWYVSSVNYNLVPQWSPNTLYAPNSTVRQSAIPGVNSERVFQTINGGTSGSTEPVWNLTKGSQSPTDGTITTGPNGWVEVTGTSSPVSHARLLNAVNWSLAGDDFDVHRFHSETQSTLNTLNFLGVANNPNRVFSCTTSNAIAGPNDIVPGATINTTSTGSLVINGCVYFYGINFNIGSGASASSITLGSASSTTDLTFKDCNISLPSTVPSTITLGGVSQKIVSTFFNNTTVTFANSSSNFLVAGGSFVWKNTSNPLQGTIPASLFNASSLARGALLILDSLDLSSLGSNTLITTGGLAASTQIINCRMSSSTNIATMTGGGQNNGVDLVNSDYTNTNYRNERYRYQGTQTTETTIVQINPPGATDGTTSISWKIVTPPANKIQSPFECITIEQWIDTVGVQHTATIQCYTSATPLTNADIWVDCYYLGNSAYPIATEVSNKPANILTPGTTLTSSSSVWGGSIFNPQAQQFSVSFTNQMRGYVRFSIKVAKAGTTIWVDPSIVIV